LQQELIRVRADLLDNLVNFAGEVSIYRSRLEAADGPSGSTCSRTRPDRAASARAAAQARNRNRSADHRALTSARARNGNAEFDPLELDRFSTLQQLSRALAESVSDLVGDCRALLDDLTRQAETLLLQQSRVSSDLQEGLMRTRMVPFDSASCRACVA
jgi:chemosensory pili system protein ChpA (sensor histidine kinase/response regulator)